MNVLVFSHESDLDGIYSAAIALMRFPQARAIFLSYGSDNFSKMGNFIFSASQRNENGVIIISDLGLNDDVLDICKNIFTEPYKMGWQIYWVDHHPWSDRAVSVVKPFVNLVLDSTGKKCAADLMYEKFMNGNEVALNLATMAHSMDFFTKDQFLPPVSELIRYYHTFGDYYDRLTTLCKKAAHGILWDTGMQIEYSQYSKLRDKAKIEAYAGMEIRKIGEFKVAFISSSPFIQSSLFSDEVFQKYNADIVLIHNNEGKVSIRRNTEKLSCSAIASNLIEGGGHKFAAGARFSSKPEDIAALRNELENAVRTAIASQTNGIE